MISIIILVSIFALLLGYRFYGRFLARRMELSDANKTPACVVNDGVDFVPAKARFLLGQHFSAISAAGPIVGPILAGLYFGWLPAVFWILLGSIFVGGVHDFTSLVASVRHKAASIGEIVKEHMSLTSYRLFLVFIWFALTYVIIAFTDITAGTFKAVVNGANIGAGISASSLMYLFIAVFMGIFLKNSKIKLSFATAIFLPLVFLAIWAGPAMPSGVLDFLNRVTVKQWDAVILAYCFIASIIPVWLLLQPRGYLGGWLLYSVLFVCLTGGIFGGFKIEYPALNLAGLKGLDNAKVLFPVLFITVACGACSGFHGLVGSGTTSKQLMTEKDALPVGYGSMLLEALVAVLALATLMMLPKSPELLKTDPNLIYANGIARYMELAGLDFNASISFALLAFSTFVYDTLDVCTRLARYIVQELFGWTSRRGAVLAAFLTLAVPFAFLMFAKEKGYMLAWALFGTSNQLLASLTLLAVSVWLMRKGKSALFTAIPMAFMLIMSMWSLLGLMVPFLRGISAGVEIGSNVLISGIGAAALFGLTVLLLAETGRIFLRLRRIY
ncbi:MAG: carbon starvation protein A [Elusimicrobia bacterium]|nr:carbon starvation protein A [Elusimicrobiota bacterium]